MYKIEPKVVMTGEHKANRRKSFVIMSSVSVVVFLSLVFTLMPLNQSLADHGAGHTYPEPDFYYTFDVADTTNDTSINKGTSGSIGDANYFSDNTQSPFVLNSTGIINEAAIQNGTSSLDTQGEIRFGVEATKSQWDFLHKLNTGFNKTSINFWINGDVVGGAEYPLLDTLYPSYGNNDDSDGFAYYVQDGGGTYIQILNNGQADVANIPTSSQIPPDDGNWHMVTVLMDKSNSTNWAKHCVDAVCENMENDPLTLQSSGVGSSNSTLKVGSNHNSRGMFVIENTFNVDDLAIWNGHQLTNEEIDFLYNNGIGNPINPVSTLKITKLATGGDDIFNFTVSGPAPFNASIDTSGGGTGGNVTSYQNLGTLGSDADAIYLENDVQSNFVVNSSGIINEAVIQNGTNSGDTQGEIHLGSDPSLWDFIHIAGVGDNVTSINFWINGDVDGEPNYPMLSNLNRGGGETDGFFLYTLGTFAETRISVLEDGSALAFESLFPGVGIPPDDGQWHMVSLWMDKTNGGGAANWAKLCIDGSSNCATIASVSGAGTGHTGTGNSAVDPLTIGDEDDCSSNCPIPVENTFEVDDVAIWNGYKITDQDIDDMYNSGVGSSAGASGEGIALSNQRGHWNFDLSTAGGGMNMHGPTTVDPGTYSVTEIIPTNWTLTNATCNDGFSSFSVYTVSNIVISAGDNIECTFENTLGESTPQEQAEDVIDDIQDIIDANPGTPLADKLEDANAGIETAIDELNKSPPDNQAALGNIEGAVGDIEAAINEGLDETTANALMDTLAVIARQIAQEAIDTAIATPGSDAGEIADAQQFLADGDTLRANEEFKDAVAKYKDALSKAESALP